MKEAEKGIKHICGIYRHGMEKTFDNAKWTRMFKIFYVQRKKSNMEFNRRQNEKGYNSKEMRQGLYLSPTYL